MDFSWLIDRAERIRLRVVTLVRQAVPAAEQAVPAVLHAIPVVMLSGLAGYFVLVALGLFADWELPYPHSFWWLVVTAMPALGVSLLFLRAAARRLTVEGEEG